MSASNTPDLVAFHKQMIGSQGFSIIENALTPEQTETLSRRLHEQADVERTLNARGYTALEKQEDTITQWVPMLLNKGDVFFDLILHPLIYRLACDLLGEECVVTDLSARITRPGSPAMNLHTDQWWLPELTPPGEEPVRAGQISRSYEGNTPSSPEKATHPILPMIVFTVIYIFDDVTEEMGPTRFVPGSHLSGRQPDPNARYQEVAPELPRGCAIVFDGRLWHGAAANRSNKPRPAVLTGYTGPQFRTLVNYPFGFRPEVAEGLTDEQRKVLGYRVWNGYGATNDFSAPFATPGSESTGVLGKDHSRRGGSTGSIIQD